MRNGFSPAPACFPEENGETETELLKNGDGHVFETEHMGDAVAPEEANGSTGPLLAIQEGKDTTNTPLRIVQVVPVVGFDIKIGLLF